MKVPVLTVYFLFVSSGPITHLTVKRGYGGWVGGLTACMVEGGLKGSPYEKQMKTVLLDCEKTAAYIGISEKSWSLRANLKVVLLE